MTCRVDGCDRSVLCRSMCSMHYQRWYFHGDPGGAERLSRRGAGNSHWKGGRVRGGHEGRYWMRHVPDHPNASPTGYVLEHRLVMEAELGRTLTSDEIVHHVNGDPTDNRPENLQVMTQDEHCRHHFTKDVA